MGCLFTPEILRGVPVRYSLNDYTACKTHAVLRAFAGTIRMLIEIQSLDSCCNDAAAALRVASTWSTAQADIKIRSSSAGSLCTCRISWSGSVVPAKLLEPCIVMLHRTFALCRSARSQRLGLQRVYPVTLPFPVRDERREHKA